MKTTTGALLLVIGVVALFAAIVGGGVKIKEIEVGSLPSRWRQLFLAIFGIVVGVTGLVMVTGLGESDTGGDNTATQNLEPSEGNEVVTPEAGANDMNAAEENAGGTTGAEANESDANNSGESTP